jgi:hypothetical protein
MNNRCQEVAKILYGLSLICLPQVWVLALSITVWEVAEPLRSEAERVRTHRMKKWIVVNASDSCL